jgi:hypothetical protein
MFGEKNYIDTFRYSANTKEKRKNKMHVPCISVWKDDKNASYVPLF